MAKDPAFLFYYDRFLSGTMTMTDAEAGQYIRLMCVQANKGHITQKDMLHICKSLDNEVCLKFAPIGDGKFANEVLTEIMDQRKNFTESRRNNRKGKNKEVNNTSETHETHMVNVNKDVIVIKDKEEIGDARGKIEALLFAGIGDLYLDGQRPKWQHINFDFEVNTFKEKVRGSPEDYVNHDTNGIRKAFQYQLRYAKTKQHNGGKGNNKKGDADRATAEGVIEAYSDVFRNGANGQGGGPAS